MASGTTSRSRATFTKEALRTEYRARLTRHKRAKKELRRVLTELIQDLGNDENLRPVPLVQAGVKEFDSFYDKAKRKRQERKVADVASCFDEIRDVVRARVICQTLADVVRFGEILERESDDFFVSRSGPELHGPDSNPRGYRSVHYELVVSVRERGDYESVTCELQVCTTLQFAWNLFTHGDVYKAKQVEPFVGSLMRDLSEFLFVADTFAGRVIQRVEAETKSLTANNAVVKPSLSAAQTTTAIGRQAGTSEHLLLPTVDRVQPLVAVPATSTIGLRSALSSASRARFSTPPELLRAGRRRIDHAAVFHFKGQHPTFLRRSVPAAAFAVPHVA